MKKTILLLLASAAFACAQDTAAPPAAASTGTFVMAGASYNHFSVPEVSGIVALATPAKAGTWSYSEYTLTSSLKKPYTVQSATTTGLGKMMKQTKFLGKPLDLFVFGNVGVAASGSTAGAAFAAGGLASMGLDNAPVFRHFGWKGFKLIAALQELKTTKSSQLILSLAIGKSVN
jgi:hypothetical protein